MRSNVNIDRPTNAKLVVVCDNGDQWDATEADLHRFGVASVDETYKRVKENLNLGMPDGRSFRDVFSLMGSVIERSIVYPDDPSLSHFLCSDDEETIECLKQFIGAMLAMVGED